MTGALLIPLMGVNGTCNLLALLSLATLMPLAWARWAPARIETLASRGYRAFAWSGMGWALAFLVIVAVLKRTLTQKPAGQALAGGMSALLAANLFPLVRFATGVPACVAAGTGYPLSLYYIHIAVAASMAPVASAVVQIVLARKR